MMDGLRAARRQETTPVGALEAVVVTVIFGGLAVLVRRYIRTRSR
jgi:hypothetical protein